MEEIHQACNLLIKGLETVPEEDWDFENVPVVAKKADVKSVFTTKEKIEEARHLFGNSQLRDIYDKTGVITTRAELDARQGAMPP